MAVPGRLEAGPDHSATHVHLVGELLPPGNRQVVVYHSQSH